MLIEYESKVGSIIEVRPFNQGTIQLASCPRCKNAGQKLNFENYFIEPIELYLIISGQKMALNCKAETSLQNSREIFETQSLRLPKLSINWANEKLCHKGTFLPTNDTFQLNTHEHTKIESD